MVLQNLRKGASGLIAKVFLLVLTVSFVLWGISGVFTNYSTGTVAEIGGTQISTDAYRQQYLDQIQRIGRQAGRAITPDQARAFGFDRQVLNQMITEATLDEAARKLGLGMSDALIADSIRDNPALRPPGATASIPPISSSFSRPTASPSSASLPPSASECCASSSSNRWAAPARPRC